MTTLSLSLSIAGPRREALARLDTPFCLVVMFSVAFAIRLSDRTASRLPDRPALLPDVGDRTARRRHGSLLLHDHNADYQPAFMYVLWTIGKISAGPGYLLLKLPAMLADVGLAWVPARSPRALLQHRSESGCRRGRSSRRRSS